jgi:hypothetical protein
MSYEIKAIDAVVNIRTAEALALQPDRRRFYVNKMRVKEETFDAVSLEGMLERMDAAGIERSFLIAARVGVKHHPACYHVPYELVADAVQKYPDRFSGLAGVDPTEGMVGVRALEHAVREPQVGAQPPLASWGSMIRQAMQFLLVAPHMLIGPCVALVSLVLASNLLGDHLRQLRQRTGDRA